MNAAQFELAGYPQIVLSLLLQAQYALLLVPPHLSARRVPCGGRGV